MNFRERIKDYKSVVVKVGTTSLTHKNGKINLQAIENLAWVLSDIRNQGKKVILVSSGAIAVGSERLSLDERPRDIIGKQVASAVGQGVLMQIYESFFSKYNQKIAQILLTKDVFDNSITRENAQNTLFKLLEMGVIPIVNENDTISTDEIEGFSDNDTLSAYVCDIAKADILIILSDIDGMYTKDPNKYNDAKIISEITKIDNDIENSAKGSNSSLGTGGMKTKVSSAKIVNKNGADMIVASGKEASILFKILTGENIGTLFVGKR
ncbi:glutamate 5-kinase [[Clostridium] colinum]|uniref:glutamate 5-kinase n=1 Tax=[Clostridium] colinum TaxID=36835 RepID=UPI002023C242|nr:glutamate 5-kinase [[Clostridium] colinum]